MDVTDDDQAHLHQRLTDTLGERATGTLMGTLATRQDLRGLRDELSAEIALCATKQDLEPFATKQDLRAVRDELKAEVALCATKQDLERFATRQDLERFATRQDLERFATRQDLERFATRQDLEAFATKQEMDRLTRFVERIDDAVAALRKELAELRNDVTLAFAQGERLRAEWKEELATYIGRQTLLQIGAMIAVVVAALTLA